MLSRSRRPRGLHNSRETNMGGGGQNKPKTGIIINVEQILHRHQGHQSQFVYYVVLEYWFYFYVDLDIFSMCLWFTDPLISTI